MTRSLAWKKGRKVQLAQNTFKSKRIIKTVGKNTRELQNDLIPNKDQSSTNKQFTYKTRSFAGPSCQKLTNYLQQQDTDDKNIVNDYYQIIHNFYLLELMKQTICISCKLTWNGDMSVSKREGTACTNICLVKMNNYIYISGLYCSLVFTCQCCHEIKINTSKQCRDTSKRDINVRSVIGKSILSSSLIDNLIYYLGANSAGIGHQGLVKLCAILNVPNPLDEDHFSATINDLLPTFESYKLQSMKDAVEEVCKKSNERKITVSGDGAWQKRGFSSLHGVVEVLSTGPTAKVHIG